MRLDNKARMNFPGTVENNWVWRIGESDVWGKLTAEAEDLYTLLETYDRLPPGAKKAKKAAAEPKAAAKADAAKK